MAPANQGRTKFRVLCSWSFCVHFALIAIHISTGLAQVPTPPITSSGLNTHISGPIPVGGKTQYDITGGTRAGANLFHSFGDFNVPNNTIANFQNDTGLATSNILGRVTGGSVSNIFGTIQTTGFGDANLFLMNPSGIVFGPNASLNIGGSVAFTTADYLRFDGNGRFHAIPNATIDALLSTAPVVAYGFLGSNPGAITVHGSQIAVAEKHTISLVGGNITVQNGILENGTIQPAHLSAPNGHIYLATAGSPGEFLQNLPLEPVGPDASNINGASFSSFGSVHFASHSHVDVSRSGKGVVAIRGGQLVLEIQNAVLDTASPSGATTVRPIQDTIVLAPGSSIITETSSADQAPSTHFKADRISIRGAGIPDTSTPDPPTFVFTGIRSNTHGGALAGNIALTATGNIEITNLANLESTSAPNSDAVSRPPIRVTGNAGEIALTSTHGNIQITKSSTVTSQTLNSEGNTGKVTAFAPQGSIVFDNAFFFTTTRGTGKGGEHQIVARNLALRNSIVSDENFGPLKSTGILIAVTGNLTLTDNSVISTASISSSATPAADIDISAKDIAVTQGSIINSATFANGSGGDLKVVTDTLRIADGAQLSSGSTRAPARVMFPPNFHPSGAGGEITVQALGPTGSVVIDGAKSGIFADTEGTGAGGAINLSAKALTIQNGGMISASTTGTDTRAIGGSIIVNATDQVTLTDGASITARSTGPADAGTISINAGKQLDVMGTGTTKSLITTEAKLAQGGDIKIQAVDRVRVVNGEISTSVRGGAGSGGNITIDPKVVILQNSEVLAQAVGGKGGDISITTPVFVADQSSRVDASTPFGLNGRVTIQSPTSNLSGTVGQLVSKLSPPQVLLQNRCVALAGGEQSTFLLSGRNTLPAEPGGWLSSPVPMEHWTGEVPEEHVSRLMVRSRGWNTQPLLVVSKDKSTVLSLRRLTPPGFLVRSFATGTTGCSS